QTSAKRLNSCGWMFFRAGVGQRERHRAGIFEKHEPRNLSSMHILELADRQLLRIVEWRTRDEAIAEPGDHDEEIAAVDVGEAALDERLLIGTVAVSHHALIAQHLLYAIALVAEIV